MRFVAAKPVAESERTSEAWAVVVLVAAATDVGAFVQTTSSRPTLSTSPGAIAFQLARLRTSTL